MVSTEPGQDHGGLTAGIRSSMPGLTHRIRPGMVFLRRPPPDLETHYDAGPVSRRSASTAAPGVVSTGTVNSGCTLASARAIENWPRTTTSQSRNRPAAWTTRSS